jgi:hypothetical protein
MEKQETVDEFIERVKKGMLNAKKGEITVFHYEGPGMSVGMNVLTKEAEVIKILDKPKHKRNLKRMLRDFLTFGSCREKQPSPDHILMGGKPTAIILLLLLLCSSCYVTTLTHSEAMDQSVLGETKENIIARAGLPDAKQVEGAYEQWTYYGNQTITTTSRPTRTTTTGSVVPGSHNASGNINSVNVASSTYSYGGGSVSQVSTQYLKLIFKDGIVVDWQTQGIDISEREPNKAASIAATLFIVAAAIAGALTFGGM